MLFRSTIPEYFETLERLPKGINYAAYAGHSAIRTYVMRERAFTDVASDDDLAGMCKQVEIAIRTGAVGLSTARNPNHRTAEGKPVASRISDWRENKALCQVMADLGYGIYEISRGINNFTAEQREEEIEALREICVDMGVPVTFGGAWYYRKNPNLWRDQFALVDEATARTVFTQVVERGSLTAAAESLNMSPPAVVRALAALERALGARLLHRTTRRQDRKSTRLNSSHVSESRMPSSA